MTERLRECGTCGVPIGKGTNRRSDDGRCLACSMTAEHFVEKPHYAPACRRGPHPPEAHHPRYGQTVGRFCECPCHYATNDGTPWWADHHAWTGSSDA